MVVEAVENWRGDVPHPEGAAAADVSTVSMWDVGPVLSNHHIFQEKLVIWILM